MKVSFKYNKSPQTIFVVRAFLLIIFLSHGLVAFSQKNRQLDSIWIDSILQKIRSDLSIDSKTKCELADSVFHVAARLHDTCSQINSRVLKALPLDYLGLSDSALVELYWANRYYTGKCDSIILMILFGNLTNVYLSLNELDRLDSVYNLAMELWNPNWTFVEKRFIILNNKAIADINRDKIDTATTLFHKVLAEAKAVNNDNYIQQSLMNLGGLKGIVGELDSSYYFLNEASKLVRFSPDIDDYLVILINMASLDKELGRYKAAGIKLDSAFALASQWNRLKSKADVQHSRAELFAKTSNFKKAYEFLQEYISLNEKYLDDERVKAVTEMMEKYESEKKARQIQQLKIENLDAELKNERITKTRNNFLYAGAGIFLIAVGLWWRLTFVHKSRAAIQKEKDISEGLLLNILPASVADELKIKGRADAQLFPAATILFSDFKSFTNIASTLSAEELVDELNACFKTFDEIMTKHGLEKIKTIGDAYMAAASVPANNVSTAKEAVLAAIEMQAFIIGRKKERDESGKIGFEMRVGIHSGPVVAGIVGVKKFQYDIWGDTVNTANRMEANGEPGRINISEATYQLLREDSRFTFIPRGLIEAKGKGEMAMYFVELAA